MATADQMAAVKNLDRENLVDRIAELEADLAYVRQKLADYVTCGFDPGMMAPTLDDIRHHLKIEAI